MVNLEDFEVMVIDFLVKLRNENIFDDVLYNEIYNILKELTEALGKQDCIPKKIFLSCIYLIDFLAGGSRFLSEQDSEKVENACNEIQELFITLGE